MGRKKNRGRACRRKVKHATEFAAQEIARKLVREGRRKAWELVAYDCPHCDAWHLGHPPKDLQEARKKLVSPAPPAPLVKMRQD